MGLFFNYDKPGKGVNKDAPKKKGFFLFAELVWRKLGKLFCVNMLHFLVSLPVIALYAFLFLGLLSGLLPEDGEGGGIAVYQLALYLTAMITILWGTGPASCGHTYILRNFAREEHVFLTSDFFEKIKENIGRGIIIIVFDVIALFLGVNAISFYWKLAASGHKIGIYMAAVVVIFLMVYTYMHFYMYQFTVTFEGNLRNTLKNSIIMAMASLPMNIILTIITAFLTYFVFCRLTPVAILLVCFLIWITLMRFAIDFYTARVIKRKLIQDADKDGEE